MVLEGVFERLLGLPARGGHNRLVIVHREQVEDDLRDGGIRGAQERLGIAGAVLELQPHQGQARRGLERRGDRAGVARRQGQHGGHEAAKLEELAPGDPSMVEGLFEIDCISHPKPPDVDNRRGALCRGTAPPPRATEARREGMLLRLMSCSAARSPAPQVTYAALCLARWSNLAALTGPEGV